MKKNDIKYSVVIPVYNSDRSLIQIITRLEKVFLSQLHESFEVIFVDDCSPNPAPWQTIQRLVAEHKNVTGIKLSRNFGKAGAQVCGFEYASGEFIITMDDDLQHCPEDIPLLIAEQQHDVVMAKFKEPKHNLSKRITSDIKGWFDRIALGKPKHVKISPFALLNSRIVTRMLQIKSTHPIIVAMILFTTRDIVNVPIAHQPRAYGKSSFNFRKRWDLFSSLLINNSNFSIRVLRYLGMGIFVVSALASIYYLARKLFLNVNAPGFTTLVIINLLFGGLILLSIGIIGEYVFRLIENVESKPPYMYREIIRSEEKNEN